MSGKKQIAGITYVPGGFHLKKYLKKMTGGCGEKGNGVEQELRNIIRGGTKTEFAEKAEALKEETTDPAGKKRIEEGKEYLLSNRSAARLRLLRKDGVEGSSTESHVSHVLSDRMSSRPMGWSRQGMANMAQLRAYYYNGGDMLELVRYQKEALPKAAGNEEVIYSSSQMWSEERKRKRELGQMADMEVYSIPYNQIKKIANFKNHIFGL